jgi:chromosome segregation ATPase
MIVSLSQDVCQQIQEIDYLERLNNNMVAIQATFDALVQLKGIVAQLKVLVILLNGRLAEQIIQGVVRSIERLTRDVQASAEKLESQPRQVKELTQCQRKSQELIDDLKAKWKLYAEEYTREALELLRLVDHLPEVEAKQATYQMLTSRLRHYIEHGPLIPAQLVEFDEYLGQLNQHLSNIEGLSVDVKKFLENVLKDQATLADLTDEVLQWCRQGEHARAFVIGFTRNKRG